MAKGWAGRVVKKRLTFMFSFTACIVQTADLMSYECQIDEGSAVAPALNRMASFSRPTESCRKLKNASTDKLLVERASSFLCAVVYT